MNQITRLYQDMINFVYFVGWKVHHPKKVSFDSNGECEIKNKIISIQLDFKNTLKGCNTLGHEIGHMLDFLDGKFKKFFNAPNMIVHDEKLIEEAEWSATMFGKEVLMSRGISTKNVPDTKKAYFKLVIMPENIKFYSGKC